MLTIWASFWYCRLPTMKNIYSVELWRLLRLSQDLTIL